MRRAKIEDVLADIRGASEEEADYARDPVKRLALLVHDAAPGVLRALGMYIPLGYSQDHRARQGPARQGPAENRGSFGHPAAIVYSSKPRARQGGRAYAAARKRAGPASAEYFRYLAPSDGREYRIAFQIYEACRSLGIADEYFSTIKELDGIPSEIERAVKEAQRRSARISKRSVDELVDGIAGAGRGARRRGL